MDGTPFEFYPLSSGKSTLQVIMGNFGNSFVWTDQPSFEDPAYFRALYSNGLRVLRVNFDGDKYLDRADYRALILKYSNDVLCAGMIPILNSQDLPSASGGFDPIGRFYNLVTRTAQDYKGMPVWLELENEPHAIAFYGGWDGGKSIFETAVQKIRAEDPTAFVIVPFDGYSNGDANDIAKTAANPITSVHIDLYDYHPYMSPTDMKNNIKPALAAGLPVMFGEYGGGDATYMHSMNTAMEELAGSYPNFVGAGAWSWTKYGMDSLPLITDFTVATGISFNPPGAALVKDYALWTRGQSVR